MKPTITIDTHGFQALSRDLAKLGGVPVQKALDSETGQVLSVCVRYTRSPKASNYPRQKAISATAGGSKISVNAGIKSGAPVGRVWLTEDSSDKRFNATKKTKTHYIISGDDGRRRHWSNERWARAQALLKQAEAAAHMTAEQMTVKSAKRRKKISGRGLSKLSWVQIGDSMGIPVKCPEFVRKAIPQDGQVRVNGTGQRKRSGATIYNEIVNRSPLLVSGGRKPSPGTQGHAILQRAIKTRLSAFQNAVKHGVFQDLKARAQRFPGVFVGAN